MLICGFKNDVFKMHVLKTLIFKTHLHEQPMQTSPYFLSPLSFVPHFHSLLSLSSSLFCSPLFKPKTHVDSNTITKPPWSYTITGHRKPLTKPHTSHPNEFHPSDYFFLSVKTTTTATTTPQINTPSQNQITKFIATNGQRKSQKSQQPMVKTKSENSLPN